MSFNGILNKYIDESGLSSKDLAALSGLSTSAISRYKNGIRTPSRNSEKLKNLAKALADSLSEDELDAAKMYDQILTELTNELTDSPRHTSDLSSNLDTLINALKINVHEMSRVASYDASYISRIRKGNRYPSDSESFVDIISTYIAKSYSKPADIEIMSKLFSVSEDTLSSFSSKKLVIKDFLNRRKKENSLIPDSVHNILQNIDNFNLEEYSRKIDFSDISVQSITEEPIEYGYFYDLDHIKKAELDFIKSTIFSDSLDDVLFYSCMPLAILANDTVFLKKYMAAIALLLKKGYHINVIHDVNRPLEEIAVGITGWLPLYMTGQLSPYYFQETNDAVFQILNNISGNTALIGECINDHFENGRYYLTNNPEEMKYYKKRAADMLSKAAPLMDIYTHNNAKELSTFLNAEMLKPGQHVCCNCSLPIYLIPENVINSIYKRNNVSKAEQEMINAAIKTQKKTLDDFLEKHDFTEIAFKISKEEFENHPPALDLGNLFYHRILNYTYEEYMEHLNAVKEFTKNNKRFHFKESNDFEFRNIKLTIHHGRWVIITKQHSPAIHFVIRHPMLRDYFERIVH